LFQRGVMDAGHVARAGHGGMRRARTLVIPGRVQRLAQIAARHADDHRTDIEAALATQGILTS